MIRWKNRGIVWGGLILVSAIPRLLGAFFLPNTFGDAYVYIRDIGTLSTKLSAGTFRLTDLFGFWLPLYQLIAALLNVLVKNGFYSGKVVAAVFGVGVCLLVYAITVRVVENEVAALLSFGLIALNPLHILNSASAMTDVPHAFFVLACLYFVIEKRWIVAALFAALAGMTRVESWMLIALIPAIQFLRERRISFPALAILLIAPASWFYISWKATGDWLACFKTRQQYHDWLLTQNPALTQFSVTSVLKNLAMLVSGADLAVLCAAFVGTWLIFKQSKRHAQRIKTSASFDSISPLLVVFFAFLALLLIAYFTHQQPIIFPRYGLILFSLGIPILAWTYFAIAKQKPQWSRRILTTIIVLCVLNWSAQFAGAVGELNRYSVQRSVADYLRAHFDRRSDARVFCDEGTVRVLSGIPDERFVTSADAPRDREGLLRFLNGENVDYLIVVEAERSTPFQLFPLSEYNEQIGNYESITCAHTEFIRTNIHVYRRVL